MRVNREINNVKEKEQTLIMTRRVLTEANTALAGVILDTSFAIFKASMATVSMATTLSRRFGGRAPASMA